MRTNEESLLIAVENFIDCGNIDRAYGIIATYGLIFDEEDGRNDTWCEYIDTFKDYDAMESKSISERNERDMFGENLLCSIAFVFNENFAERLRNLF